MRQARRTPPVMSEMDERFSGRRSEILLAMQSLLVEKGVDGFSMRRLAERVGMSLASLQYHFPSKERLWSEFMAFEIQGFEAAMEGLDAAIEADPRAALEGLVREVVVLDGVPETAMLFAQLWALGTSEPSVEAGLGRFMRAYVDMVGRVLAAVHPEWSEEDVLLSSTMVVSVLEGLNTTRGVAEGQGVSTEHLLDFVVQKIWLLVR